MEKIYKIGGIVGRFQVPFLHDGHIGMIKQALNENDYVFILLGCLNEGVNEKNKFSYQYRVNNFREVFKGDINRIVFRPIFDTPNDDELWSSNLDMTIYEMVEYTNLNHYELKLYHSRDSFVDHYYGIFETKEYECTLEMSGTHLRKTLDSFQELVDINNIDIKFFTIDADLYHLKEDILLVQTPFKTKTIDFNNYKYKYLMDVKEMDVKRIKTILKPTKEEVGDTAPYYLNFKDNNIIHSPFKSLRTLIEHKLRFMGNSHINIDTLYIYIKE